jgi:hypothetical protein
MRFFHSFSSQPCLDVDNKPTNLLYNNVIYFATSLSYIKKNFPNVQVVLHTDKIGYDLLSELPYDEIYLTLEGKCLNKNMFASGKIEALKNEPLESIHIDGDVFLYRSYIIDYFKCDNCDVFVECVEIADSHYGRGGDILNKYFSDYNIRFGNKAFSCGVMKFNNQKLKDEFIESYYDYLNMFNGLNLTEEEKDYKYYDLYFEQINLFKIVENNNYKYDTLFGNLNKYSIRNFGYVHKQGSDKFNDIELEITKTKLLGCNPEIYNNLINKINKIKK